MNKKCSGLLSASIATALLLPSIAHATMGMDLIGFGAKSRGMGGIGVAYAQDTLSIAYNPANAAKVGSSRFDIGGELFNPKMAVVHDSAQLPVEDPDKAESLGIGSSRYEYFPMPFMGYAEQINEDLSWGIAVVGAGLVTSYDQPDDTFFNFKGLAGDKVGVYLIRMLILPTLAYEVSDDVTVGVSLVAGIQGFKGRGFEAFGELGFASAPNDKLTSNQWDTSYGLGIKLGALWDVTNDLTLGVSYAPRLNMSEFDRYSGLFAEQGDFDVAEEYALGINYKINSKSNISFEISQVNYNDIKSVGNPGPSASDPSDFNPLCPGVDTIDCKLGGDNGMGFGWQNQTRYKIGGDYAYSEKLTLRAGWAYAEAPIPGDQVLFNLLAPATVENNLTLGASYQYADDIEISMNYLHGFANDIKGPTAFPPGAGIVQGSNAAIAMVQDAVGVTLGLKF